MEVFKMARKKDTPQKAMMREFMQSYLKENDVQIAALTLPRNQAKAMAELVTANGVKAIWNFAHTDLKLPEDVIVESVHLSDSLMQLSYNMSNYKDKTQKKSRTKEK